MTHLVNVMMGMNYCCLMCKIPAPWKCSLQSGKKNLVYSYVCPPSPPTHIVYLKLDIFMMLINQI